MIPFLKNVARVLVDAPRLDKYCIVVPNKRSGTFLLRYFREETKRLGELGRMSKQGVVMAPRIVTIADFISEISGLETAGRIDMLFSLFNLYSRLPGASDNFDSFRVWGDIALADFNEVDLYCVDADELFKNLSDVNEIQTSYLTDEQKLVVEEYFRPGAGIAFDKEESFWKHFNNKTETGQKFLHLWETMGRLYHELGRELASRSLAWSGGAARRALERIRAQGRDALPYLQIVFVGFNALTTVEYNIFREIKKLRVDLGRGEESLADFYWDAGGGALLSNEMVSASHFLKKNLKNFPSKHRLDDSAPRAPFPEVLKAISCPGNTAQTKVASEIISDILSRDRSVVSRPGGLAVAMPDENLFFPMIYSLPEGLEGVNITMGYPLRLTSASSWMSLIRRMNLRSRPVKNHYEFLCEDFSAVLSHPLTRILLSSDLCVAIADYLSQNRFFQFDPNALLFSFDSKLTRPQFQALESLLQPIKSLESSQDICDFLMALLETAARSLSKPSRDLSSTATMRPDLEVLHLEGYALAVRRLQEAMRRHSINMEWKTLLSLLDHLLASEKVALEGKPLTGVQIMGMLETRSLDFDYIILPSMNERIFPRRLRASTFIPNSLRARYFMATTEFQEGIFAYYFYRLISRAKEVYLLYDARRGGLRSGDPSRYIYQLKYLFPTVANLKEESRNVSVALSGREVLTALKTPDVMEALSRFITPGSNHYLSASALKKYLACPMQFFFQYVRGYNIQEAEPESMDAKTQGNIFHDIMRTIYDGFLRRGGKDPQNPDFAGVRIAADDLRPLLRDVKNAEEKGFAQSGEPTETGLAPEVEILADNCIRRLYLHVEDDKNRELTGFADIFREPILQYVRRALIKDLEATPFFYIAGELEDVVEYQVPASDEDPDAKPLTVNMKFIIDRLDRMDGILRVVDYKTGSDKADFSKVEHLFSSSSKDYRPAIFQLMLYATLLSYKRQSSDPMGIALIRPQQITFDRYANTVVFKGMPLTDYRIVKEEFLTLLHSKLRELFDPTVPFTQCKRTDSGCSYCNFKAICKR